MSIRAPQFPLDHSGDRRLATLIANGRCVDASEVVGGEILQTGFGLWIGILVVATGYQCGRSHNQYKT